MASMMFERVIPSGKDAYFPLQFSSTGLSPSASVYEVDDTTSGSPHSTVAGTVVELSGGLYALKVANSAMTSGKLYYATVSAGIEVVRVQTWAYAPQDHLGDVLSKMGATGPGGLFADNTSLYAEIQEVQTEIGDVSAAGITGSPASVAAALKVIFDEVDGVEEAIGAENDAASAATLFGRIKQVKEETAVIDGKVDTIDGIVDSILVDTADMQPKVSAIQTEIGDVSTKTFSGSGSSIDVASALKEIYDRVVTDTGDIDTTLTSMDGKLDTIDGVVDGTAAAVGALNDAASADYGTSRTLMAMVRKAGADLGTLISSMGGSADSAAGNYNTGSLHAKIRRLGELAEGSDGFAAIHSDAGDAKTAAEANKALLEDGTYGLAQLQTEIAGIQSDLDNATDGLGALKAGIDANQADLDTILADTNEMQGDLADGGRLDLIFDATKSAAEAARDDLANGTDGLGAIKAAVDANYSRLGAPAGASISADIAAIKLLADNLTDGTHGLAALDSDLGTLISELGDNADVSSDATVFGKIAAMAAKVDALQRGVNARLIPSAPELIYAGVNQTFVRVAVQVRDGETGALEDPDQETGATSGDGHVAVKVFEGGSEITASANNRVYEDSGSTSLAAATNTAGGGLFDGWHLMKRTGVGTFEIFLKVPAGHNGNVQFEFQCADSDPSSSRGYFYATRDLTIRNAVAPLGQFGAF
jgi:hypothetical protein